MVTVFIPEYVVGKWWENLLHNQSALRIKGRLLFEPGVMVTSVPYQLASTSTKDLDRLDRSLSRSVAARPAGHLDRHDRAEGRRAARPKRKSKAKAGPRP